MLEPFFKALINVIILMIFVFSLILLGLNYLVSLTRIKTTN